MRRSRTIETHATSCFHKCLSTILILVQHVTATHSPAPLHMVRKIRRDSTGRAVGTAETADAVPMYAHRHVYVLGTGAYL
jgi:hypothetical protein